MDNIICTFHPTTEAACEVLRDPRNADLLIHVNVKSEKKVAPPAKALALSLTLDRAPKTGATFVIGRHPEADIVLTNPASSARHCLITVSNKGVAVLHDQSTNGTWINGKHYINETFDIQSGMQLGILDAAFDIRVPWRGESQGDYEYKAMRAKESRAATPLEAIPPRPAPTRTPWVETLGPYTLTNTFVDGLKLGNKEASRTEIVRKGRSFYAAKRFNSEIWRQRELRAWEKINNHKTQHPNIISLKEIIRGQSGPILIMELLPKGSLDDILYGKGPVTTDVAVGVMRQLLDALDYLHRIGIVHMSVQLDNLLVFSEHPTRIKLTGFELSTCGEPYLSSLRSACPAPEVWERYYRGGVAPSIWEDIMASRGYHENRPLPSCGSPVDIWSSGIVCSQLALQKTPCYQDNDSSKDEQAAHYVDIVLLTPSGSPTERSEAWAKTLGLSGSPMSPPLLDFLQKLLDTNPESRVKAQDCFGHPWLTQHAQCPADDSKKHQAENTSRKRQKLDTVNED